MIDPRAGHPLRLQYEIFSSSNPLMALMGSMAERVRAERRPAGKESALATAEAQVSKGIAEALDGWRVSAEKLSETVFHAVYGSKALQAALGIDTASEKRPRRASKSLLHRQTVEARVAELRGHMENGGAVEALARALIYLGLSHGSADERDFMALRRLRRDSEGARHLTLQEFKAMVREQFFLLVIDEKGALGALPALLPADPGERRKIFTTLETLASARGALTSGAAERLAELAGLFDVEPPGRAQSSPDGSPMMGRPAHAEVQPAGRQARSARPRAGRRS